MFKVVNKQYNWATGIHELTIMFQLKPNGNIINYSTEFTTESQLINWLEFEKKNYILLKVENFVFHKKHIFENSKGADAEKLKTINMFLFKFAPWAIEKASLTEIKKILKDLMPKLESLMPSYYNKSFESSKDELKNIKKFIE